MHGNSSAIGLSFLCPHCKATRLSVMFWPPIDPNDVYASSVFVYDLRDLKKWNRVAGDSFDSLTITPSINCEASGHWHGFITDGKVA